MSDPRVLKFQLGLGSESLNLLAKDDLRFIYQDSTGMRNDGVISSNELDKTKKPEYIVEITSVQNSFFIIERGVPIG